MPKKPNGRPLPPCDRKTKEEEEGTIHKLVPKKGGWSLPPYSRAATAKEKEGYNLRLEGGEVHKQEEERGKRKEGGVFFFLLLLLLSCSTTHTYFQAGVVSSVAADTVPPTPSLEKSEKLPAKKVTKTFKK